VRAMAESQALWSGALRRRILTTLTVVQSEEADRARQVEAVRGEWFRMREGTAVGVWSSSPPPSAARVPPPLLAKALHRASSSPFHVHHLSRASGGGNGRRRKLGFWGLGITRGGRAERVLELRRPCAASSPALAAAAEAEPGECPRARGPWWWSGVGWEGGCVRRNLIRLVLASFFRIGSSRFHRTGSHLVRPRAWVHSLYQMHPCVVYTYSIYIYIFNQIFNSHTKLRVCLRELQLYKNSSRAANPWSSTMEQLHRGAAPSWI
jgi:hypothetical protein